MGSAGFLQDLTVVLFTAAAVLLLFRRLGQPPVPGYLAAGLLIGSSSSPLSIIQDVHSLESLAEIGVIFLLFALGVEFNLKRLARVGLKAWLCAGLGFAFMMAVGVGIAQHLGWPGMERIAFGGTIALASTAIVARTLLERARHKSGWEELIAGKLIVEDVIAVVLVSFFASIAAVGNAEFSSLVSTMARFGLLVILLLFAGALVMPKMLAAVERGGSAEVRTLVIVGTCFAVSLLTAKLGFSAALGAFMAGAITSLAGPHPKLHETVEPFKDLFGGIFFVSVGMLIDPAWIIGHGHLALGLAVVVVFARILANFTAVAVAGETPVGAGHATLATLPIGEFSFILAQTAQHHGLAGPALYPLAVTLCLATTLSSALLFPRAIASSERVKRFIPGPVEHLMLRYRKWIQEMDASLKSSQCWKLVRPSVLQIAFNFLGLSALLLAARTFEDRYGLDVEAPGAVWLAAVFISLPFLNAMLRKTQAVAMIMLEAFSFRDPQGASIHERRPLFSKMVVSLMGCLVAAWFLALSWRLLPPWPYSGILLLLMLVGGTVLWRGMNQFYAKLQILVRETMAKGDARPAVAVTALSHFAVSLQPEKVYLDAFGLGNNSWAIGKTIGEVNLRAKTGSSILQINRSGSPVPAPGSDAFLMAGDEILLIGESPQIKKAKALLGLGRDPASELDGQPAD